jgi:2-polyprenyl-6-methoxyphenol hydroxylase-like FAD-dependent oxidoreductase
VLERSGTTHQIGFALSLAANALAALRELGLAESIEREGHVPGLVEIRRTDGPLVRQIDSHAFSRPRRPALVVARRSVVHECLLRALGSGCVELNSEVADYRLERQGIAVRTTDNRTAHADLLIGADGFGSLVRRLLHPSEAAPRFSGYWALRGLSAGGDDHLGKLSATAYLGPGVEAAAIRAGEDAIYWYASLLQRHVPTGTLDPQALLERCPALQHPAFSAIARSSRADAMRLEPLFTRDPLPSWGQGAVTLVGDAAHPVLPHTGQGAALALEDAVALGLALSKGTGIPSDLRRYESVRRKRTAGVIRSGPRIAGVTTTPSRWVASVRNAAIRLIPMSAAAAAFRMAATRDPHRRLR